ncbi:MAG: DUF192 domain-containing protein [Nanoarchaeota archaeon]
MLKRGKETIVTSCKLCQNPWSQGLGLMFRKRLEDECYIFVFRRPRKDYVTMLFMRFSIDIIWLNENKKVIDIYTGARPYQRLIPFKYPAKYMIEMNEGMVDKFAITKGQILSF